MALQTLRLFRNDYYSEDSVIHGVPKETLKTSTLTMLGSAMFNKNMFLSETTVFRFYDVTKNGKITSMLMINNTGELSFHQQGVGIWKFDTISQYMIEYLSSLRNEYIELTINPGYTYFTVTTYLMPQYGGIKVTPSIPKPLENPIQTHEWYNGEFVAITSKGGAAARPRVKKTATSATWVPSKPRRTVRIPDGSVRVLYSNPWYPGQHRIRKGRRGGDGRITYSYVKAPTMKRA